MKIEKTFWGVGQGGFFSGVASDERDNKFTYVYDAGSDNYGALRREIDVFSTHVERVDVCFVSHLDSDHVNGLEYLLSAMPGGIKKVVLPYLDIQERIYALAHDIATGGATQALTELVLDPVGALNRRGIEQVEFIGATDVGGDDLPRDFYPPLNDGGRSNSDANDFRIKSVWTNTSSATYEGKSVHLHASMSVEVAGVTILQLVPHVGPKARQKLQQFELALKTSGLIPPRRKLNNQLILEILSDKTKRELLRECYLELASDHNLVSMHLLSRIMSRAFNIDWKRWHGDWYDRDSFYPYEIGTVLLAGDANLRPKKYFDAWLKMYGGVLSEVGAFSLPHHGAYTSFNPRLLRELPESVLFVSQAGDNNRHGHPHPGVTSFLEAEERSYFQVSEIGGHRLAVRIQAS